MDDQIKKKVTSTQESGCHKDGNNIISLKTSLLKLWYFSFCPSLIYSHKRFQLGRPLLRLMLSCGQDLTRATSFLFFYCLIKNIRYISCSVVSCYFYLVYILLFLWSVHTCKIKIKKKNNIHTI